MSSAVAPRLRTVRLREYAAAPASGYRVDPAAGIVFGARVCGRTSRNTHRQPGARSSAYTTEALKEEARLVEGINVNIDHPPASRPLAERSARDRVAWLENVRVTESGLYGDLHFLTPDGEFEQRVLAAAEKRPQAFALSHDATGLGEVKDGVFVISRVPEVRAVDLVADGGSNVSLREGREMAKRSIRTQIRESKVEPKLKARLLEIGDDSGAAHLMEEDAMEKESMGNDSWKGHVMKGVGCLTESDDPADHDLASKLMKHLRPPDQEDEDAADDKASGGPDAKKAEDEKAKVEEGRKRVTRLARGFLNLRESDQVARPLVDALCKLPDDDARLSLLESWPRGGAAQSARGNAPRSAGRGSLAQARAQEGAPAKSAEELAGVLLR